MTNPVVDLNSARRCRSCGQRLVKREDPAAVTSHTWNVDGQVVAREAFPNGIVMWVCAVCDLKEAPSA